MSLSRGQRLKLLRQQKGVEQQEAAEGIGISGPYLSLLERDIKGRNMNHLRGTLERAAAYYSVMPAYLVAETPQEYMHAFVRQLGGEVPSALNERVSVVLRELQLRWGDGYSAERNAEAIGTTQERLADYAEGREPITTGVIEQLSRLTGVPAAWFRPEAEPDPGPRPEVQGLVEYALANGLDPQELKLLIDAWLVAKSKRPSGG